MGWAGVSEILDFLLKLFLTIHSQGRYARDVSQIPLSTMEAPKKMFLFFPVYVCLV